ncbi:MAG: zinc-dependent metalloprotease [Candidatus Cloacimonetes bacterium]|nr:zinc-dependent metalloprotease [Candidatus Cloacimonadota bacterium]
MKKTILILLICYCSILILASSPENKETELENLSSEEILKAVHEARKDSLISNQDFIELIKDMTLVEGLFNLYQNEEDGKIFLELKPEHFQEEFLLTVTRQTGDAYYFDASAMMWSWPFSLQKVNRDVHFIMKNFKFRAEEPAMQHALEKCISTSLITSAEIVGKPHPETGAILIKAEDIFLSDIPNVEKITESWETKYSYDAKNSFISSLKSFPLNTEVEVMLHYKSGNWNEIFTLPDSRSMYHRYHYSLSTLPASDFKPRRADDRIGYFTTIYQDYSNLLSETPYIRYINRWHLEKENPKKAVSKVKNPIVFWLENTIPPEYVPAVKKGILLWNKAFEEIGLRDAIVVREMPEDAEWDPADSRYNTVRWIIQPGGGYAVGPSHANPYTGEIYDADIRISVDFIRYFFTEYEDIINPTAWNTERQAAIWKDDSFLPGSYYHDNFSSGLAQQAALGYNILSSTGYFNSDEKLQNYVEEGLISLVVHEVGHTLGLRHNFKASTIFDSSQLANPSFTTENGICGSVMDYTPVNLLQLDEKRPTFFQTRLGPWDTWMIAYGYTPLDPDEEVAELERMAAKGTEPYLDYGTDEDAFGLSTRGVDPLCSMFDLGKDPLQFYESRIELAKNIWDNLTLKFEKKGKSYKRLLYVFNQGLSEYRLAAHNVSKYIGGLYTHRDHIGDNSARLPFQPVPSSEQYRAINLIIDRILSENAFDFDPELLNKLVLEKMETFSDEIWNAEQLDYPVHKKISDIHRIIFAHLYDPLVLHRLSDNALKYSSTSEAFTVADMMTVIDQAIWKELQEKRNINSFRRNLQKIYLDHLEAIALSRDSQYPRDAVSLSRYLLKTLHDKLLQYDTSTTDILTRAHLAEIEARIEAILNAQIYRS